MAKPLWIPEAHKIAHEAIVVMLGAIIAAAVIGQLPPVRNWIKKQWDGTPQGL